MERSLFGLDKAGIDGAALLGRVFVDEGGGLGAVDDYLGGDDDPVADSPNVNQVALRQPYRGADGAGNGHLAVVLDSHERTHRDATAGNPESQASYDAAWQNRALGMNSWCKFRQGIWPA
jgi:hypothetical protein